MIKKSPIAVAAILLALSLSSATATANPLSYVAQQSAEKKDPARVDVFRKEWVKPYDEIQKLINDKKFDETLEKVKFFEATENKTPYESFLISRIKAVVASITGKKLLLAKYFQEMIASGFLTPAEKLSYTSSVAATFFEEKQYQESLEWTKKYLAQDENLAYMQDLLVRNYYFVKDMPSMHREAKRFVQADVAAKRVPSSDRLNFLLTAASQIKNAEEIVEALELFVTYYPTKEYWGNLLYRLPNKAGFSERMTLDQFRILLKTESIEEDPNHYTEIAERALLAALPLEAKNIMEAGYKAKVLGVGGNAAKHKQLLDKTIKQAAEDTKSLDAGEAAAKGAKTGLGMVNMGYNFVIHGQFEKGISLMEQGIAKGGLKFPNEATLHLGMAYLQSGNREKATEIFKELRGTDGSVELARYWLLVR